MSLVLKYTTLRRMKFTSKYNMKLYKKSLSLKLLLKNENILLPNLTISKDKEISAKFIKTFYNRREIIPIRLLRFFYFLDYDSLLDIGVKFLLAKKLSVYTGRFSKLININKSLQDILLKCSFKFGDLIFTRARFRFKKKKKKKK